MRSTGHLFVPRELHVDLRIAVDLDEASAGWGWKVQDALTQELVWVCAHPSNELFPSGRWLARSLLEGSNILHALHKGEVFPPKCHR